MAAKDIARDLIKRFEGCKLTSYQDMGGIWTIGYGHTGLDVKPNQTITQEQADNLLEKDLTITQTTLCHTINWPINENQLAAVIDFCYNLGVHRFATSTLLQKINENDKSASDEFLRWVHVNGMVVQGLVNRREAEKELFLKI